MGQGKQKQEPAPGASCKAWVGAGSEPLFHIDAVNIKTGKRVRMTAEADTESACRTNCRKLTAYPWRRLELIPATS